MKIITANVNGIRSAASKGFFEWMLAQDADVVCLQETKAQEHQLPPDVLQPFGYRGFFFDALKKGNSGVAVYTRLDRVFDEIGWADAFRVINPGPDQYSCWSNRGRAREKNVGWRIDFHVVSPPLRERIVSASIYKEKWFSDHAPLTLVYEGEW